MQKTGEPFKVWQKFGTTDEAQNFRIQKFRCISKIEMHLLDTLIGKRWIAVLPSLS